MSVARRLLEHFVRPAGSPWPAGPEAPDDKSPPALIGRAAPSGAVAGREAPGAAAGREAPGAVAGREVSGAVAGVEAAARAVAGREVPGAVIDREAAARAVTGREAVAGAVAGRKPRGRKRRDAGRDREAPSREAHAAGHGASGRNTDGGDPPAGLPIAIAVLATLADAGAIGCALGLAAARCVRAPVAAVCVWTPGAVDRAVWGAPSWPAARRLAFALAARGLDARATGRLAQVRLDADCEVAARQARRVIAAAGDAPAVLALGGPRSVSFEELLAQQDLVVVALRGATNPALAHLALDGLQRALPRAPCACDVPASGVGRVLASAGLALHPALRRALAPAIEALR